MVAHLGIDISDHNAGLDIPTDGSVEFVIARASLAETNQDASYHNFRSQCEEMSIPFAAYHFVYPPLPGSTYREQADNFREVEPDRSIPVMLDVEPDNDVRPSMRDAMGVADELRADGYHVPLLYLPHWYWDGYLKRPGLSTTFDLVSSDYGANTANQSLDQRYAARAGDRGSGWTGYGGLSIAIWQFTSKALVDRRNIDGMAYKNRLDSGYFKIWDASTPPPDARKENDMYIYALAGSDARLIISGGRGYPAHDAATVRAHTDAGVPTIKVTKADWDQAIDRFIHNNTQ